MYENEHKFPYRWTKKDANFTKDKGKVMSCFCCGGGSSFGYKLAGYDVVACNEIDPKVMKMYLKNHDVKPWFACGMCVPPVMMANVAARIWDCWLSKIKKEECA